MASTTNFGWSTPDDTSLVKDGAAAIRTLGSSIDTSMGDLKGGTTGQVLTKNSGTDMDFVWNTPVSGGMTLINAGGTALSGTSTQISSIPGTYKNLEIWVVNAQINADTEVGYTINNDTGSQRYYHYRLFSQNTTPGSATLRDTYVNLSAAGMSYFVKNSTENMTRIVIPNYAATGIKQIQSSFVGKQAGIDYVYLLNSLVYCYNTSAVTSFEFRSITTGSFSGGTIYVYGVN